MTVSRLATKLDRALKVSNCTVSQNAISELHLNHGHKPPKPLIGRLGFYPLNCSRDALANY